MNLFQLTEAESVGKAHVVQPTSALITVPTLEKLQEIRVNRLVVLQTSDPEKSIVGVVARTYRGSFPSETAQLDQATRETLDEGNLSRISFLGTLIQDGDQLAFKRSIEEVPPIEAHCFLLEGERLKQFMQTISRQGSEEGERITLGAYTLDKAATAYVNGNRLFQRHTMITGSTGSGKSWTTARILDQAAQLANTSAILFDIHGEYKPIQDKGVRHLRIAGPNESEGPTALSRFLKKNEGETRSSGSLEQGILHLPFWLLTYDEMLALFVSRKETNAPNQVRVFRDSVLGAKEMFLRNGNHEEVLGNLTINSPVPFDFDSVIREIKSLNEEVVAGSSGRDRQGTHYGKLTTLLERLISKTEDRRFGFMFRGPVESKRYEWLASFAETLMLGTHDQKSGSGGVKIIDFSEVPSEILPLVVGLIARMIFSIQQWVKAEQRHPIAIFCDEAHLYMPHEPEPGSEADAALRSFERIAKEGRKYGIGLVIISQRPSEISRTVLSQINNFIVMRLTNSQDQEVIRRLLPDNWGSYSETLPILDVGEAMVVGDATLLPTRIKVHEPNSRPLSNTVEFWDCWSKSFGKNGIWYGTEALRRQAHFDYADDEFASGDEDPSR